MHGGEVQVGELPPQARELRPESPQHKRARQYLAQARRAHRASSCASTCIKAIDEEALFGEWAEAPMQRRALRAPRPEPPGQRAADHPRDARAPPRRAARGRAHRDAAAQPHAGRRGAHRPARSSRSSMVGPTLEEARHVVEQVVSQVQGMLPDTLELGATIVKGEAKRPGRTLID